MPLKIWIVALFVLLPSFSYAATTTVSIAIDNLASTTSRYTIGSGVIPAGQSCTYSLGYGTVLGEATGSSGSCNTNDFLVGDNSVRVQPNFDNPILTGLEYTGKIVVGSDVYLINWFRWSGSSFIVDPVLEIRENTYIISQTPENGATGTTTQAFSVTFNNANPTVFTATLAVTEVSGYQSFAPVTKTFPVTSSGINTLSTTTVLTEGSTYLFKWILKDEEGQAIVSSRDRFVTLGSYAMSPYFEYSASSTVVSDPALVCEEFSDWLKPLCNMAVKVFGVSANIFTSLFVDAYSRFQAVPPFSWYYQITSAIQSASYSKSQSDLGINVALPFSQEMSVLTTPQLNEWTGNNLANFRYLTTVSIWLLYLVYITRRVLTIF